MTDQAMREADLLGLVQSWLVKATELTRYSIETSPERGRAAGMIDCASDLRRALDAHRAAQPVTPQATCGHGRDHKHTDGVDSGGSFCPGPEKASTEQPACIVSEYSSRGCELGTKGCDVPHGEPVPPDALAVECDTLAALWERHGATYQARDTSDLLRRAAAALRAMRPKAEGDA